MNNALPYLVCPNCNVQLAVPDELDSNLTATPPEPAIWWSDGQFTSKFAQYAGTMAKCPECWAVFPKYHMADFLSTAPDFSLGKAKQLVVSASRAGDNGHLIFDESRKVEIPNYKTWRLTSLKVVDDDPVLQAIAIESFIHAHNNRLRSRVLRDKTNHQRIFDNEPSPKELELFVARVKNGMITGFSYSDQLGANLGDFFGTYRLLFLCAEISRTLKKFEWADEFIEMIEIRRLQVDDFADDLWEHPIEVERVTFPTLFWLAKYSEKRLDTLRTLVYERNPYLATVFRAKI